MKQPSPLQAWWKGLSPRERRALSVMGVVLAVFVMWQVGIAMPLNSLRDTARQQQQAQAEWNQVQVLRAQALALRQRGAEASAKAARGQSTMQVLQALTLAAGDAGAQVNEIAPGNYSVRFDKVSPEALAVWLQATRQQARLLPQTADFQRVSGNPVAWQGSIVLGGS
ncbi:type II secretion system protein GspM [Hylemonella sp. W303a]|uniref:type II secretion system protein GspM n=1 Tax=Hylemonella sp. W303a TaxID=3389873 RepID=UPI00396AF196